MDGPYFGCVTYHKPFIIYYYSILIPPEPMFPSHKTYKPVQNTVNVRLRSCKYICLSINKYLGNKQDKIYGKIKVNEQIMIHGRQHGHVVGDVSMLNMYPTQTS